MFSPGWGWYLGQYERGQIRDKRFANQVKDYSGLLYGKITPTDIDGFLDFGNKVFVFLEVKYGDTTMATGQRLALERLSDACQEAGKQTLVVVASHESEGDIDVANLPVTMVRFHKRWLKRQGTVREVIDTFLDWVS